MKRVRNVGSKLEESQAELLEAQRELEALQKLVKP